MANYWLMPTGRIQNAVTGSSYEVSFQGYYVGSDVKDQTQEVTVRAVILLADTPATILTKVTSAVVATAATVPNSSGTLGVTVLAANGLIPSFQRGA